MKKQFHKIKIAVENNFPRSNKSEKNNDEILQQVESRVEKYKDVLEKITKKFSPNSSSGQDSSEQLEKRCKKVNEYRLAQSMEESLQSLDKNTLLREVMERCARLEKNVAHEIVKNEISVENDVTKNLNAIMENHISGIQKQKRTVHKLMQDNESAKTKHQTAIRLNENSIKINLLKEEQEEYETKLEKERDIWAAEMFELIVEEDFIANCIVDYIKLQQLYYKTALQHIELVLEDVGDAIKKNNGRVFKVPLVDHLVKTDRKISSIIELCVCCLMEKGLNEEGLLRIGCAGSKLKRMKAALDANLIIPPFQPEYQDVHVIAGILKSYLRDLPDPLLSFKLYNEFVLAAQRPTEELRKNSILHTINQLPREHYNNLRYLMKFLSILSKNSQKTKMSSQNLAIVMSPNLLWQQNADADYADKVNSTAAVNTIVELMISDWDFFFEDSVNFYVTLTQDRIFIDGNGLYMDRDGYQAIPPPPSENTMSKSMIVGAGVSGIVTSNNNLSSHSRSSSHDTSLINLGEIKRSQSNSSLSDHSSPLQGSPKLPVRRKHNKSAAPTPPANELQKRQHYSSNENILAKVKLEEKFSDPGESMRHPWKLSESTENLSKPDKPPRPAIMADCQTLNRLQYKNQNRAAKPKAMPRNSLHSTAKENNVEGEETVVLLRDRTDERPEKPAIPERPASLIRPPSLKGNLHDLQHSNYKEELNMRPYGSFRSQKTDNGTNFGSGQLERTHIYNVDKQQVALIDLGDKNQNNGKNHKELIVAVPDGEFIVPVSPLIATPSENLDGEFSSLTHVPPSPRGFDPKSVKRPQVPAPPPPTNRPKSQEGNSTNL